MTNDRTVLDLLTRDELLSIVDSLGLVPNERRAKAPLVDAIASSDTQALPTIPAAREAARTPPWSTA